MMNRRSFLTAAAGLGAGLAAGAPAQETPGAQSGRARPVKLGVCTYSYWHFRGPKVPIETVFEKASELGLSGVDILHRQMDLPETEPLTASHRAYLRRLKRHAFRNGVAPVRVSIHHVFGTLDCAARASPSPPLLGERAGVRANLLLTLSFFPGDARRHPVTTRSHAQGYPAIHGPRRKTHPHPRPAGL